MSGKPVLTAIAVGIGPSNPRLGTFSYYQHCYWYPHYNRCSDNRAHIVLSYLSLHGIAVCRFEPYTVLRRGYGACKARWA